MLLAGKAKRSVYRVRVAKTAEKGAADLLDDLEPLMETGYWCASR